MMKRKINFQTNIYIFPKNILATGSVTMCVLQFHIDACVSKAIIPGPYSSSSSIMLILMKKSSAHSNFFFPRQFTTVEGNLATLNSCHHPLYPPSYLLIYFTFFHLILYFRRKLFWKFPDQLNMIELLDVLISISCTKIQFDWF